jgi:hypothetical protein
MRTVRLEGTDAALELDFRRAQSREQMGVAGDQVASAGRYHQLAAPAQPLRDRDLVFLRANASRLSACNRVQAHNGEDHPDRENRDDGAVARHRPGREVSRLRHAVPAHGYSWLHTSG